MSIQRLTAAVSAIIGDTASTDAVATISESIAYNTGNADHWAQIGDDARAQYALDRLREHLISQVNAMEAAKAAAQAPSFEL